MAVISGSLESPARSPAAARLTRLVARLVMIVTLATAGALASAGCQSATDKQVIEQADTVHAELSKAVVTDPSMANYIQQVGDRIVVTAGKLNASPYGERYADRGSGEDRSWMFDPNKMKFHFVNSTTLNAFTTGGEHMYVYTELLRQTKSEAELAAVMAHEYAHVYGRHIHKGMNRQMWTMLGTGAAAVAGYAAGGEQYAGYGATFGAAVAGLGNAYYSRGDEDEADHIGFDIYVRAGWPPDQFPGFFRTLLEAEAKGGGAGPEFLSDHPSTAKRVASAEKWAAAYKQQHPEWQSRILPPVASEAQYQQIKERSKQIAAQMPDDKSLSGSQLVRALPRSCMFPDEPMPPDAKAAQAKLAEKAQKMEERDKQVKQSGK